MYHTASKKLAVLEGTIRAALTEIEALRNGLAERADARREGGRRAYYEDHEAVKKRRRDYYHSRATHRREMITCEICGARVQRASIYRHRRSARCRAAAKAKEATDVPNVSLCPE